MACLHRLSIVFMRAIITSPLVRAKKRGFRRSGNPAVSVASFGLRKSVPGTCGRRAWSCQNFALVERQIVHNDAKRGEVHLLPRLIAVENGLARIRIEFVIWRVIVVRDDSQLRSFRESLIDVSYHCCQLKSYLGTSRIVSVCHPGNRDRTSRSCREHACVA